MSTLVDKFRWYNNHCKTKVGKLEVLYLPDIICIFLLMNVEKNKHIVSGNYTGTPFRGGGEDVDVVEVCDGGVCGIATHSRDKSR